MSMSEKAKELRRQYQREWRKRNPDKVKKHQKRYWERQAERIAKEVEELEHSQ